jgi:hypothetical protein
MEAKPFHDWTPVKAFHGGTPVRFQTAFHEKHKPEDLFIVNAVCSSYRPKDYKYTGKICVTNLRTGDIAYVEPDRSCVHVNCRVEMGHPEDER